MSEDGDHRHSHRAEPAVRGTTRRAEFAGRSTRRAVAAVVLVILGIAFAGVAIVAAQSEQTSYFDRSTPPQFVHLTKGKSYLLSVHGGADTLSAEGLDVTTLKCQYSTTANGAAQDLPITALAADSRAVNSIGTIDAPITGDVRVQCTNFTGNVYLDGADGAPFDLAGLYILLCLITLTLGLGLGIAAIRGTTDGATDAPVAQEEIAGAQGLVR
jgi:hypothetical protein